MSFEMTAPTCGFSALRQKMKADELAAVRKARILFVKPC
jgi:hypothetical protein